MLAVPFELREREKWNQSKWELRLITKKPLLPLPFSWTSPCGCGRGCGCGRCCGCSHSCGCWLQAQEEEKGRVEELKERKVEPNQMRAESSPLISLWPLSLPSPSPLPDQEEEKGRVGRNWETPNSSFNLASSFSSRNFEVTSTVISDQENFSFTKKMGKNLTSDKIKGFLIPTPSLFAQNWIWFQQFIYYHNRI